MAASLGVRGTDPVILADGANVIVHLSPAPVVAKVAASTTAVRPEPAAWLQRELDVTGFLAGRGIPAVVPSPEVPATVHHGDGQVMSFWRYVDSSGDALPGEATIGSMLRDLHAALRGYPGRAPGSRILAAYGDPAPPHLAVCQQLRRLHLTVWYALYTERLPQLRSRAAELLALWPAP